MVQYQTVSGGNSAEGTGLRIGEILKDTMPERNADKVENTPAEMVPEEWESGEKEPDTGEETEKTEKNETVTWERKWHERENEDYSKIGFLNADEMLNSMLLAAPDIKDRKEEIQAFYESHEGRAERKEYVMSLFRNGITEYTLENGETVGYETYENVLHLWRGKKEERTGQGYFYWEVITEVFEGLCLFGRLSDRGMMTTADGQLSFMEEKAGENNPAFSFPQEFIDHVLIERGSGMQHGKFRIYSYFLQGHSRQERAEFLKKEYGTGGCGPVIIGTDIDECHP